MKLEIRNVTKMYHAVRALDGFSVTFTEGIYGLLGANGAGKSTLINMITDNIMRDYKEGGSILLNGKEILSMKGNYRRIIGYMPQHLGYYPDFSVYSFLRYIASLKGLKKRESIEQITELLHIVNLETKRNEKIEGLSGGMKQRTLLAGALIGDPKILILDEPTVGLDPSERISFRNHISNLSKDKIILYATHIVSDIECIADQIIIMKDGKIVVKGSPSELIASLTGKVCEVPCSGERIDSIQDKYISCGIRQRKDKLVMRIVGDEIPEVFERTNNDINLEDVYIYYSNV